jgi:ABC-type transporter Mla MlaB component
MVISLDDYVEAENTSTSFERINIDDEKKGDFYKKTDQGIISSDNFKGSKLDFVYENNVLTFFGELIWEEIQLHSKTLDKIKNLEIKLTVDITDVYKIDSSGTGLLISLHNSLPDITITTSGTRHKINNPRDIIELCMNRILNDLSKSLL